MQRPLPIPTGRPLQRVGLPRAAIVLGALALTGCASAVKEDGDAAPDAAVDAGPDTQSVLAPYGIPVDAGEHDTGAVLAAYGISFHPDGGH